uniref:Uncharacterized protein n=1 Tax=Anser cygnoides TaxID=8845 RepID=A0A8B9EAS6_ANSCY
YSALHKSMSALKRHEHYSVKLGTADFIDDILPVLTLQKIQTRWRDNDQHGHANHVVNYCYFDFIISHYLIRCCGLDTNLLISSVVGFMVTTQSLYHASLSLLHNQMVALAVTMFTLYFYLNLGHLLNSAALIFVRCSHLGNRFYPMERQNAGVKLPMLSHVHVCPLYTFTLWES